MTNRADIANISPELLAQWQREFESSLPRIETHGRVYFRDYRDEDKLNEAIAEMRALAWRAYLNLRLRGRDPSRFISAIASFSARQVRCGRRVTGQEPAKDAMSSVAQRRKGFTVQSLPEHDTATVDNETLLALQDNTVTPPPDQAAFRMDYPRWLKRLGSRNSKIAKEMASGETTHGLADKHGISESRVSQMRRQCHDDWERFHGEEPDR